MFPKEESMTQEEAIHFSTTSIDTDTNKISSQSSDVMVASSGDTDSMQQQQQLEQQSFINHNNNNNNNKNDTASSTHDTTNHINVSQQHTHFHSNDHDGHFNNNNNNTHNTITTTITTTRNTGDNHHHNGTNGHHRHSASTRRTTIPISTIQKAFIQDGEISELRAGDVWYVLSMKWIQSVWIERCQKYLNDDTSVVDDDDTNIVEWNESMQIDQSDIIDSSVHITSQYLPKSIDVIMPTTTATTTTTTTTTGVTNGEKTSNDADDAEQKTQCWKPLLNNNEKASSDSHVYSVALKPNLQEEVDFKYVSSDLWHLLVNVFGCCGHQEQSTIERRVVIDGGRNNSVKRIELYPYLLHLIRIHPQTGRPDTDSTSIPHVLISKKTLLCDLRCIGYWALELYLSESKKTRMAAEMDLKGHLQRHVRVWNFLTGTASLMDNLKMNMTLEDALLVTDQRILFEIPINDVWPLDRLHQQQHMDQKKVTEMVVEPDTKSVGADDDSSSSDTSGSSSSSKKKRKMALKFLSDVKSKFIDRAPKVRTPITTPVSYEKNKKVGLCGLRNLGNTCFMNSALQCLSNTQPLNDYFLSGSYVNDVNKVNPLGSKGKLAKEFASLMKDMWSGSVVVAPLSFKHAIGQFAPQFSGFAQHDAQELTAYLLDGLHEDLNRVRNKPMVELQEANGRADEIVAEEAWRHHLLRNQSIIVDLFQGQLKSTLTCPDCSRISIKFDPFMYLSVPIPHTSTVIINIIMVEDVTLRPKKYCIEISSNHTAGVLRQKFADEFNFDSRRLLFADMIGNTIDQMIHDGTPISYVSRKKQILCFNLPKHVLEQKCVRVRVTQVHPDAEDPTKKRPCAIPIYLFLSPERTANQIYEIVWSHIQRYTTANVNNPENMQEPANLIPFDPTNRLFSLFITDPRGERCGAVECSDRTTCTGCRLPCDDTVCQLVMEHTLTVDWHNVSDINHKESMTVNLDPSVNECRQRIHRQITLEDCLSTFSEVEQLGPNDPWYCPNCRELKQAYKKFEIWSAPEILCIHLKRFVYTRNFRERLDKFVDFPIERMDLGRFMVRDSNEPLLYDLYAVSNHMGSLGGGHYIAHAKNRCDGNWYSFNDSSCNQVPASSLVSNTAYMLFYQRRRRSGKSPDIEVNLETTSTTTSDETTSTRSF